MRLFGWCNALRDVIGMSCKSAHSEVDNIDKHNRSIGWNIRRSPFLSMGSISLHTGWQALESTKDCPARLSGVAAEKPYEIGDDIVADVNGKAVS